MVLEALGRGGKLQARVTFDGKEDDVGSVVEHAHSDLDNMDDTTVIINTFQTNTSWTGCLMTSKPLIPPDVQQVTLPQSCYY